MDYTKAADDMAKAALDLDWKNESFEVSYAVGMHVSFSESFENLSSLQRTKL
jgi:hypothetical protein